MRTRPSNVPAALDALGIEYVIRGDEATALCPFHEDRRPSWSCNIQTGDNHCFSCGAGGSFVRLVSHVRGSKRREASEWCSGFLRSKEEIKADPRPVKKVRAYGEADLVFFTHPPQWALEDRNLTAEACAAYGVLWDPETDAWILPIREPEKGRLIGWQEKADHFFRNRPKDVLKSSTLFGYQLLEPGSWAVLVESPLDAPRMRAAGVRNVVSSFGVEVSSTQLGLIEDRCCGLINALDNDRAGDKQCKRLKYEFTRLPMKFFDYADSGAKDPGEMTDEEIRYGVEHAIHSWKVRF